MTTEDMDELEAKKPKPESDPPKPRFRVLRWKIPAITTMEKFRRQGDDYIPSVDDFDETLGHLDRDVLWRFKRSLDN